MFHMTVPYGTPSAPIDADIAARGLAITVAADSRAASNATPRTSDRV
jgi:hypothetical protein